MVESKVLSVLLSLPSELCHVILDEWLTIEQWSHLDVAVCNQVLRYWLLEQFKLLSNHELSNKCNCSVFEWITARSIKLKYLFIVQSMVNGDGSLKITLNLEFVFDLHIRSWLVVPTSGDKIINQCKRLKQLRVACQSCFDSIIDPTICSELTLIDIYKQTTLLLKNISDTNIKLKTFKYCCYECVDNYDTILEIIRNNPHLEYLQACENSNRLISTVYYHCKHMKYLSVYTANVNLFDVQELLDQCPALEYFVAMSIDLVFTYDATKKTLSVRLYNISLLNQLLCCFNDLECINFDDYRGLFDEVMDIVIARYASTLQSIEIGDCPSITASKLQDVVVHCSMLKEIVVRHGRYLINDLEIEQWLLETAYKMKQSVTIKLLQSCPQLELYYYTTASQGNNSIDKVVKDLEELRQTNVNWCLSQTFPSSSHSLKTDVKVVRSGSSSLITLIQGPLMIIDLKTLSLQKQNQKAD